MKKFIALTYLLLSGSVIFAQVDSSSVQLITKTVTQIVLSQNENILPQTPKQIVFAIVSALTGLVYHWLKVRALKKKN